MLFRRVTEVLGTYCLCDARVQFARKRQRTRNVLAPTRKKSQRQFSVFIKKNMYVGVQTNRQGNIRCDRLYIFVNCPFKHPLKEWIRHP